MNEKTLTQTKKRGQNKTELVVLFNNFSPIKSETKLRNKKTKLTCQSQQEGESYADPRRRHLAKHFFLKYSQESFPSPGKNEKETLFLSLIFSFHKSQSEPGEKETEEEGNTHAVFALFFFFPASFVSLCVARREFFFSFFLLFARNYAGRARFPRFFFSGKQKKSRINLNPSAQVFFPLIRPFEDYTHTHRCSPSFFR